jgi:carbon monoxide dehydrogenase subunit G
MQEYKSPKTPVEANISDIFAFLSNFNNFEGLMPQQQITNWKSTEESCSFTVQGMGDFGLKIKEKIPETKIIIEPDTAKPIPVSFNLICELAHMTDETTEAMIRIEADLPVMIAMMAGKPLQNLVNILAERLQQYFKK